MRTSLPLCVAVLVSLNLGACSLAPQYARPALPVPEAYPVATETQAAESALDWTHYFQDPDLQALIKLALENNRDLRIAVLRIEEARAQYGIQKADRLPTINGTLGYERSRSVLTQGQKFDTDFYRAGVNITDFELDFFGRVKNLSSAALEQFLSTQDARESVQTSLVAEQATAYVNLLALNERLTLAQDTLKSRQASLSRVKRRYEGGLDNAIELKTAEIQASTAQASASALAREQALAINALHLLTGDKAPPNTMPPKPLNSVQVETVAAGLPSQLLEQRADIRAAEHRLIAANANIGAARAAFFPRIQLTTSAGLVNDDLLGLFGGGSDRVWSFTPQLILPIFNHGRNKASLDLAVVRKDVAVAEYEKAIQTAFREVADVLVVSRQIDDEIALQSSIAEADRERLRLATRRYERGVAGYLELLDAQRSLFESDQQLVQLKQLGLVNKISLYKALGGH
ncbi:efflux transporter outer membrane subunit [Methylovorus menthalis]|uniref:efflux transporter outer membrane subunit n=1 Tax=Methylovorus menthalis TaxID=1002227 RepID=UPI001E5ABD77|nr:efflux transporter outer membrane subunit [Methylovorus menthalis]MCB4810000.1 efflux transporter outer membrane subunit [Methylovorus menthalis]